MLHMVDLTKTLSQEEYVEALAKYQAGLFALTYQVYLQQRPVAIVFEGWDTAGKGEAIRKVTENIDPRGYMVHAITTPQGDDAARHYLWRFWRRVPEAGQIAIFDRSWYERVLGDRVEGICSDDEWKRAYREINQFERQMVDFGTILFKFWMHISPEEQLARFEAQANDRQYGWRLSEEEWRDRERRRLYEAAVNEMLLKTSTINAPWTVVEANSKGYAQIKVLQNLVEKLSQELAFDPFAMETQAPGGKKLKKSKKKAKKKKA